jgi:hypothetical protein
VIEEHQSFLEILVSNVAILIPTTKEKSIDMKIEEFDECEIFRKYIYIKKSSSNFYTIVR